ncbi:MULTISPECIES: multidrug resistance efflux transporter family protein [unclassified Bacillus (in: firmicutes)]|uniref:DMT family transporter n=1 Tax=unclassified Bacillus (in: firmicutes) TaxID=185979 RepID=UPI0008ED7607|nr:MULTISPECIES: multidrug resistance efflux transporter family protein [unclassified Bacillus (in: firmicutes)]SFA79544.1 Putative multidrug resistance efflux transporter [Bacillus sp. UNCCL13]SFQ69582.1 Putative multidrug resistance efflux transporter [Bacillus sp. cl95]
MRPLMLGIFSAFFFAFTFVLNRAMELSGGSWIWSASLRYYFMVPLLLIIVAGRGNLRSLLNVMKEKPGKWLLWSTVGFGLFYAPICFTASYSPGWLIAGTWQITIISGSLLVPFFYEKVKTENGFVLKKGMIPVKGLLMSSIILIGVFLMQIEHAGKIESKDLWLGIIPIIIASFAYPLGNRKMMEVCEGRLDAYQRVLGMTIASMPFWILLSVYGVVNVGLPTGGQIFQSGLVAVCSGVIATVLFFQATDSVRGNMKMLASVEATQSMEVVFALAGEVILLSAAMPSTLSWIGIVVLMAGMFLHSYISQQTHVPKKPQNIAL